MKKLKVVGLVASVPLVIAMSTSIWTASAVANSPAAAASAPDAASATASPNKPQKAHKAHKAQPAGGGSRAHQR